MADLSENMRNAPPPILHHDVTCFWCTQASNRSWGSIYDGIKKTRILNLIFFLNIGSSSACYRRSCLDRNSNKNTPIGPSAKQVYFRISEKAREKVQTSKEKQLLTVEVWSRENIEGKSLSSIKQRKKNNNDFENTLSKNARSSRVRPSSSRIRCCETSAAKSSISPSLVAGEVHAEVVWECNVEAKPQKWTKRAMEIQKNYTYLDLALLLAPPCLWSSGEAEGGAQMFCRQPK